MTESTTQADSQAPAGEVTLARSLERFMAERGGDPRYRVAHLRRAGSGRSRDNWLFDLESADASLPQSQLILRTDPDGGLVKTDRRVEFELLRALEGCNLPTPTARWLDVEGEVSGNPALIMGRLPGTCDYRVLSDESRAVEQRADLARKFCEILAAIHAVDWAAAGIGDLLPDPGEQAAATELARWLAILHHDQLEPWPELEYAAVVLGETAPQCPTRVLVHADFKPGNLLLDDTSVTGLLDWELAHVGDPLEDLGWVTQSLRASEHTVEGAWTHDDLIRHYELVTSRSVDRSALAWWNSFSAFKTAVMQVSGLRAFVEERADDPYRPTRRVLLTLLDEVLDAAHLRGGDR